MVRTAIDGPICGRERVEPSTNRDCADSDDTASSGRPFGTEPFGPYVIPRVLVLFRTSTDNAFGLAAPSRVVARIISVDHFQWRTGAIPPFFPPVPPVQKRIYGLQEELEIQTELPLHRHPSPRMNRFASPRRPLPNRSPPHLPRQSSIQVSGRMIGQKDSGTCCVPCQWRMEPSSSIQQTPSARGVHENQRDQLPNCALHHSPPVSQPRPRNPNRQWVVVIPLHELLKTGKRWTWMMTSLQSRPT